MIAMGSVSIQHLGGAFRHLPRWKPLCEPEINEMMDRKHIRCAGLMQWKWAASRRPQF